MTPDCPKCSGALEKVTLWGDEGWRCEVCDTLYSCAWDETPTMEDEVP